jgi:hypothetical protein
MSDVATIEGVDLIMLQPDELIGLIRINQNFSSSNQNVVMIMKLSEEDNNEQLITLFEATLAHVDIYILYYPPHSSHIERNEPLSESDVEADSNYDLPRALQNRVHLDVPYEFGSSWQDALAKAWKHCQRGSLLIAVNDGYDMLQTLDMLRTVRRTTKHVQDSVSRAVEFDQDTDDEVAE